MSPLISLVRLIATSSEILLKIFRCTIIIYCVWCGVGQLVTDGREQQSHDGDPPPASNEDKKKR